jgi:hypothetical protein
MAKGTGKGGDGKKYEKKDDAKDYMTVDPAKCMTNGHPDSIDGGQSLREGHGEYEGRDGDPDRPTQKSVAT